MFGKLIDLLGDSWAIISCLALINNLFLSLSVHCVQYAGILCMDGLRDGGSLEIVAVQQNSLLLPYSEDSYCIVSVHCVSTEHKLNLSILHNSTKLIVLK